MAKSSSKAVSDTKKARQEAVEVHHRDLSTEEIGSRMHHMNTLLSMFDGQRTRAQRTISEAGGDVRTCDKMMNELRADIATLDGIIKSRRN